MSGVEWNGMDLFSGRADQRAVVRVVPPELGVQFGQTVTLSCVTFGGHPAPKEARWSGPDGFNRSRELREVRLDENYVAPYDESDMPLADEFGAILYRKTTQTDSFTFRVSGDAKLGDYSCLVEPSGSFGRSLNVGRLMWRVQARGAPALPAIDGATTAKPSDWVGTPVASFEFGGETFGGTDEPLFNATVGRSFTLRCVIRGKRTSCDTVI